MMNLRTEICNAFSKHATEYEQAAKVQNEIGERLFERLHYLKINPRYVLDLGCGTGLFSKMLKKLYPQAEIIGLDLSYAMLQQAQKKQGWRRKWPLINADMVALPFVDGLFDLVFANQVVHWAQPLSAVIQELNRVMNVNSCLMFSTLGPDTFKELKQAWLQADQYAHTNEFIDMHDIGDCLLMEHFLDPVVDMELLTVHYPSLNHLLQNLKAQGVRNINQSRNEGLTGKTSWQAFESAYQVLCTAEGKYPLTYEVVYGHAWKGSQRRLEKGTETFIPISQIRRNQG
ncbi:biotin synthase [Legionella nautarum]|uniref:Malonyl-[acyl-carrier protein] O-methyltransferase n=2 Tax=Legionella nautarum TaxID=45070 RepID=A0A0W0WKD9_9GAMM|nr:biotin synthase [Legionella nautarum]